MVSHQILLGKLKEYGLDETSINWFKSYLEGREQCVQVESVFSEMLPISVGIPQGSILGPLLFVVFVNDMPFCVKDQNLINEEGCDNHNSEVVLYADDNMPTTFHKDPGILQQNIQCDAILATQWIQDNELVCSVEKTKLLVI